MCEVASCQSLLLVVEKHTCVQLHMERSRRAGGRTAGATKVLLGSHPSAMAASAENIEL